MSSIPSWPFWFLAVLGNRAGGVDRLHSAPSAGRRRATLPPGVPERPFGSTRYFKNHFTVPEWKWVLEKDRCVLFYSRIKTELKCFQHFWSTHILSAQKRHTIKHMEITQSYHSRRKGYRQVYQNGISVQMPPQKNEKFLPSPDVCGNPEETTKHKIFFFFH